METVTKQMLRDEALRLCEKEIDSDEFRAYLLLLASTFTGADAEAVARRSGLPLEYVMEKEPILRRNGIWDGKFVAGEQWLQDGGGLALTMDACVVLGLMEKARGKPFKSKKVGAVS